MPPKSALYSFSIATLEWVIEFCCAPPALAKQVWTVPLKSVNRFLSNAPAPVEAHFLEAALWAARGWLEVLLCVR